ncbi:MAG: 16S rRNA (cytosine(1402)-N(4))-methyltransferase RsmH [Planctomycetia bacterium]|nr:16S rRNA (cytosine(1402)-N(4))-methyltransferase RsmH [Planctomycetia bacterium]
MTEETVHIPVMLSEILEWLSPRAGQIIVDGTLGGGGHTRELAKKVAPGGVVISLDRDPEAISRAEEMLRGMCVVLVESNFSELPEVLKQLNIPKVDGIMLDLGLSSDQLADNSRGFSFHSEGMLDLRFNPAEGKPAWALLQSLPEKQLADIIYEYGEERFSRRIARKIVERRATEPVRTAKQLADLVHRCVPYSRQEMIDRATRTFQALRIAVNREMESLETVLKCIPECVRSGGSVAILSFHSLEDRRVKEAFRDDFRYDVLTKKPIFPSQEEINRNPRSRSAKLRVAKIAERKP